MILPWQQPNVMEFMVSVVHGELANVFILLSAAYVFFPFTPELLRALPRQGALHRKLG